MVKPVHHPSNLPSNEPMKEISPSPKKLNPMMHDKKEYEVFKNFFLTKPEYQVYMFSMTMLVSSFYNQQMKHIKDADEAFKKSMQNQ